MRRRRRSSSCAGSTPRYPTNPVFLQRIAEISRDDLRDHHASMTAWQTLLARSLAGRVEQATTAETRARIGLAREMIELSQLTGAVEQAHRHRRDASALAVFIGSDRVFLSRCRVRTPGQA
jgi:hypothetical protein